MKKRQNKPEKVFRHYSERYEPVINERTVEFPVSSEEPVERMFGMEILSHRAEAIDLSRFNNSAPLLLDHDPEKVVGVIKSAEIRDARLYIKVKITRSQAGQILLDDINDGIRRNVSIGYRILEVNESDKDGKRIITAVRWIPLEASFVGVPADQTVGIGRAEDEHSEGTEQSGNNTEIVEEKVEENAENPIPETPELEPEKQTEEKIEIEVKSMDTNVKEQEQMRAKEIFAIGEKFDCRELAQKAVIEGLSVDQFRADIMDKVFKAKPAPISSDIGMSDKEIRRYSMFRAINAIIANDWKGSELERDASKATAVLLGKQENPNSFFLPHDVAAYRGFSGDKSVVKRTNEWVSSSDALGAYAVGTEIGPMIGLLMNSLFSAKAGVTILEGLTGNLALPRHASNTWASWWVSQATAASQLYPALEQITLTPKEIAAYSDVSTLMIKQGTISTEQYIQNDLAKQIAIGIDTAIIKGGSTGGSSGAPTKGLLNTTLSINSVNFGSTTAGAAPSWAKMVELETEVAADNAIMPDSKLAYIANARVIAKLKTTLQSSLAGAQYLLSPDKTCNGYPVLGTNIMPNTSILFGDFSQVILGLWGGTEILVDPYSQSSARLVRLVASQACDYNWMHVESFAKGNYVLST